MRGVEREAPAPGLDECAEQDRDLRQARRVDHLVTVQHREPGRVGARDVDEGQREMAGLDLGGQAEIAHDTFEPPLERRVGAVVEVACSAGVCGRGPRGRRERERRAETGEAAEQVRNGV